MADPEIQEAERALEIDARCNMDLDTAREEASWYSIMNVMALNLGSGMGIQMDQSETYSTLGSMGLCPAEMPIQNPVMLKAVFKSGDPHLMKQFDQSNFETWRWSPDSFDNTLVPQAQGWNIIALTECAKWFGLTEKVDMIPADFRKEWMTNGLLLAAVAREQCEFTFDNLRNDQGLFMLAAEPGSVKVKESGCNLEDQVCMLWASSDLASLAGMSGTVYADEDFRNRVLSLSDQLFMAITANKDSLLDTSQNKVLACSIAVPALIWHAAVTEAPDHKAQALWLMRQFADDLVKAQEADEMVGDNLVDAAAALRALCDAFRVTRMRTYAETAVEIFNFMEGQWWKIPGVYSQVPQSSEYTYNADDIGIIAGALNAARLFLKDRVDKELAQIRMRVFFCSAVNLSGLQMSMPSLDFVPQWLMQRESSMHFRHDSIPLPAQAGGDFGIAPVFAGEVGYDPQTDTWSRRMLFDSAAAMHACCELLWLNQEAINGFADIKLEEAPLAVRQAAGVQV